jgi:hypothetical protein
MMIYIMTFDFSMKGAPLLATHVEEQENLLLACPEMLVASMFASAQQIIGHNKHLVLFDGITKFGDKIDISHEANYWDVCSDRTNYDRNKNVRIALKQYFKTGISSQHLWSGIQNIF